MPVFVEKTGIDLPRIWIHGGRRGSQSLSFVRVEFGPLELPDPPVKSGA